MMQLSENAANTRTLIMGLVLSLAVMLPLKFYATGEEIALAQQQLETTAKVNSVKAMHLANLRKMKAGNSLAMQTTRIQEAVLGASTSCINSAQAQEMVRSIIENAGSGQDTETMVFKIKGILKSVCR